MAEACDRIFVHAAWACRSWRPMTASEASRRQWRRPPWLRLGLSLLFVGVESNTATRAERPAKPRPGHATGCSTGWFRRPRRRGSYLTAGGGFYRERLGKPAETASARTSVAGPRWGWPGRCGCASTTGCSTSAATPSTRHRIGSTPAINSNHSRICDVKNKTGRRARAQRPVPCLTVASRLPPILTAATAARSDRVLQLR